MKPTLTVEIARACGQDAGNRSMRDAGRKVWSEEDYNAARDEMRRLLDNIYRKEDEKCPRTKT